MAQLVEENAAVLMTFFFSLTSSHRPTGMKFIKRTDRWSVRDSNSQTCKIK